jgi:hypothetical protein
MRKLVSERRDQMHMYLKPHANEEETSYVFQLHVTYSTIDLSVDDIV